MRGGDDTRTTGPHWGPAGQVPFREFAREAHAWINVTTGNMTPPNKLQHCSVVWEASHGP
eukprot:2785435-Pyramimonas_sp.AAC.1